MKALELIHLRTAGVVHACQHQVNTFIAPFLSENFSYLSLEP